MYSLRKLTYLENQSVYNHGDRTSPKDRVMGPLPNGLFIAYKWRLLTTYKSWDDPPSSPSKIMVAILLSFWFLTGHVYSLWVNRSFLNVMDLSWWTLEFNALKHPEPSKLAILWGPIHPCKKQVHSPFHYRVPNWSSGQDFLFNQSISHW